MDIEAAIASAKEGDELRTASGAIAASKPCRLHCSVCEWQDHHWMPECDDDGDPLMVCAHCEAWREMTESDLENLE